MRPRLILLLSLAVVVASPILAKMVHVTIDWTFDQKRGSWTSKDTGLTLGKTVAGYAQKRAEPVKADGRGVFGYSGPRGVITLYVEHRLAAGLPATGDITPEGR